MMKLAKNYFKVVIIIIYKDIKENNNKQWTHSKSPQRNGNNQNKKKEIPKVKSSISVKKFHWLDFTAD